MQLTSETRLFQTANPYRANKSRYVAASLIASTMMLNISTGTAQELPQSNSAQALIVTNADNYRSSERMTQQPQPLTNTALPNANPEITPRFAIGQDPLESLIGNDRHQAAWLYEDAWITDIGTLLYRDDDEDGYFSGFSLTIDADTHYQQADIYASIDVQRIFGERERLHTSGNFTLYGNSLSDEYRIDIDLLKNYSAGDYDIYIALHDAYDHRVLDSVGAAEFTNLYRLPLESDDLDIPNVYEHTNDPIYYPDSPPLTVNHDIRAVEYAGSSGYLLLLALLVIVYVRKSASKALMHF